MKSLELEEKEKDFFLSGISNKDELLVLAVEPNDFSYYTDFLSEKNSKKAIYAINESLTERLDNRRCFRLRGEKFLFFFQKEELEKNLELKLKRKFKKSIIKKGSFFRFSGLEFTLGLARGTKNTVIKKAILALEYAKRNNLKNSCYTPQHLSFARQEYTKRITDKKIKELFYSDNLMPYYQKIISNKDLSVLKCEALARMNNNGKIITPDIFIPAIRRLGLSDMFSRKIITLVFNDVYIYKTIENASINITTEDTRNRKTLETIEGLLKKHTGKKITFEITETIGVKDYKDIANFTKLIKKYGARISIDDFGSGHSGYEHLIKIDTDYIKIDGKFIKILKDNIKARILIKGICDFAKENNIEVIAEYIEDKELYSITKELGVNYSQGYYFSKPEPIKNTKE